MAYLHIDNLYKNQDIMLFKGCYAMEKIHGTSAHLSWKEGAIKFFSGGEKHENFMALFNQPDLTEKFKALGQDSVIVYGEAYGGKCQGMRGTYGPDLRFVAFEVKIGESWLSVPQADEVVKSLGLEFVHYVKIPTTTEALDAEMMADSVQAVRNGIGQGKMREGIVLRPLIEVRKNNGERIIAKHKRDEFKETKSPRKLGEDLEVMKGIQPIVDEWVTPMRLTHVLDKLPHDIGIEQTGDVIKAMIEDIKREAEGEIEHTKAVWRGVSRAVALMFKDKIKQKLAPTQEDSDDKPRA